MKEELRFLGLLNRGGRIMMGETLLHCLSQVKLIIKADDCSATSNKAITNKAASHQLDVVSGYSKAELGECIGVKMASYLGITDGKAAARFLEKRKEQGL